MYIVAEYDSKKSSIVNIAKTGFLSKEAAHGYVDHVSTNRLLGEWGDIVLVVIHLPVAEVDIPSDELHIDNVIPVFSGFNFVSSDEEE